MTKLVCITKAYAGSLYALDAEGQTWVGRHVHGTITWTQLWSTFTTRLESAEVS